MKRGLAALSWRAIRIAFASLHSASPHLHNPSLVRTSWCTYSCRNLGEMIDLISPLLTEWGGIRQWFKLKPSCGTKKICVLLGKKQFIFSIKKR